MIIRIRITMIVIIIHAPIACKELLNSYLFRFTMIFFLFWPHTTFVAILSRRQGATEVFAKLKDAQHGGTSGLTGSARNGLSFGSPLPKPAIKNV